MRTTLSLALLLAACSKKEPAASASDATATATVIVTATVTATAAATATDAAPVPAAAAPATAFYLISPTRLDADLVLGATEATKLSYAPGTELAERLDHNRFTAVRRVSPPRPSTPR